MWMVICNADCRRMMSSFRHLLCQSQNKSKRSSYKMSEKLCVFVVNEKSRTMEEQWQSVNKNTLITSQFISPISQSAQAANLPDQPDQPICPISQLGHYRVRNKHRATLINFWTFFQELRSLLKGIMKKKMVFVTWWAGVFYNQGALC